MDTQAETLEENRDIDHQNPNYNIEEMHDFETLARAWLSTLPADKSLNTSDVETWLQSNNSSLPDHIKSMPPSDVYQMFTSFLNDATPPDEEKDPNHARFQRTDQWMPIYSWLESLKTDEVIKSKEIIDWLTENPEVRDDLSARHSRYHLMHYIKKCHMKILKRKEKKKHIGLIRYTMKKTQVPIYEQGGIFILNPTDKLEEGNPTKTKDTLSFIAKSLYEGLHTTMKTSSPRVHKIGEKKSLVVLPGSSVAKLPKDSPIYIVKRNEAFRKYEILIEMEKQLATIFQKQEAANV